MPEWLIAALAWAAIVACIALGIGVCVAEW